MPIPLAGVTIGWISAVRVVEPIIEGLEHSFWPDLVIKVAAGSIAGLIGGSLTVCGAALASRRRRLSIWIAPMAFATLAGNLLFVPQPSFLPDFTLLFIVWQAGVAALIVRALRA